MSNNKNNNNKNKNNNKEEKVYVLLKLNKNIAQLLRIFANTHADKGIGSTENKRIDNFLTEEVTKIIQALASDSSGPAQEPFPDSLKQHVQNLLLNKETDNNNNNKKWMEDLK